MLQGLNLPFFDIASAKNGLNIAIAAPAEGAAPLQSFADLLRLKPDDSLGRLFDDGIALPLAGNELPVMEQEFAATLPESGDGLGIFWAGTLPTPVPDAAVPRLPGLAAQTEIPRGQAAAAVPALPTPLATTTLTATAVTPPLLPLSGEARSPVEVPVDASILRVALAGAKVHAEQLPAQAATPVVRDGADLLPTGPAVSTATSSAQATLVATTGAAEARPRPLLAEARPTAVRSAAAPLTASAGKLPGGADALPGLQTELPDPLLASVQAASGSPSLSTARSSADDVLLGQLAQLQSLQAAPPAARNVVDSVPTATSLPQVATPVQDDAWGDQIADRLMLMADNKMKFAEIRLTPAELGPLRVQIAIDDGAASVTFHAQHAATREALEQAMPRLRDLLANSGLTLEQSHIADAGEQGVPQGKPDQRDTPVPEVGLARDAAPDADLDLSGNDFTPRSRPEQLLDTFA